MGKAWNMEVMFEKVKSDKKHPDHVEFVLPPHMDLSRIDHPRGQFCHINSVSYPDKEYAWFYVESTDACQELFQQMKTAMTKQFPDMEVKLPKPIPGLLADAAKVFGTRPSHA